MTEQTQPTELVAIRHESGPPAEAGQVTYADVSPPAELRPVIPDHLRTIAGIKTTAKLHAARHSHRARYHGIRLPWYLFKVAWYATRGAATITARLVTWWHWTDGWLLESMAVAAGRSGHADALRAHTEGKKTRTQRGQILGVCLVLLAVGIVAMLVFAPWWAWTLLASAVLTLLVSHGKPKGKPIIQAALIPTDYQPPTHAIISRALGALGIPLINQVIKEGPGISFVSDVHRDGPGWACQLDLPHGVTASDILARRESLASGLRRPLSATWPTGVPQEHAGRLDLWVGFHDISKTKPPAWPLLKAGTADVFAALPFGTDPRGKRVDVPMFEVNWLIGAAPGQGKTAAVRALGCGTALDPLAELWVHELAGKGDLEPLAKVSHRYTSGLDDESIAYAAASLRLLRTELDRRSVQFKKLPKESRPDGKVTREMAEKRGLRLHPLVAIFDEIQNLFMHPTYGAKAADDAGYVIRLGRAYGIILVLATQRPDKESLPTAVSGIVTARFCLKVPDYMSNDLILGTGAYKSGYNATAFRAKTDAGLGWLKGEGEPQVLRTYYIDGDDAERISIRARAIREKAGTLSGYALGELADTPARVFAADVLSVFGGEAKLWTETIAGRLADRIPEAYSDVTQEAVASQLRGLGVPIKDVREPGQGPRKGAEREAIEAAAGLVASGL